MSTMNFYLRNKEFARFQKSDAFKELCSIYVEAPQVAQVDHYANFGLVAISTDGQVHTFSSRSQFIRWLRGKELVSLLDNGIEFTQYVVPLMNSLGVTAMIRPQHRFIGKGTAERLIYALERDPEISKLIGRESFRSPGRSHHMMRYSANPDFDKEAVSQKS